MAIFIDLYFIPWGTFFFSFSDFLNKYLMKNDIFLREKVEVNKFNEKLFLFNSDIWVFPSLLPLEFWTKLNAGPGARLEIRS